jgi:hypothetical protein
MSSELQEFATVETTEETVTEPTATEETPAEDSATEQTPQPDAQPNTQVEDTTGEKEADHKQAATEDSPPEPADSEKQPGNVPLSAMLDERDKRQKAERRAEDVEAQLQQMQQPQQAPDILDDPQGFTGYMQQQITDGVRAATIQMSQMMMRSQHDDYDQAEDKFMQMAQSNPQLVAEFQASSMPAQFVYNTVKKAEQYADMQNVDGYKAKLKAQAREEVKAELEAEAQAKADKDAKLNGALSPSLANTRAAGANNEPLTIADPMASGGMFDR